MTLFPRCRHQTSVTAGTLFHSTNLPLVQWFLAIYLMACDKGGISALRLSRQIGVSWIPHIVCYARCAAPWPTGTVSIAWAVWWRWMTRSSVEEAPEISVVGARKARRRSWWPSKVEARRRPLSSWRRPPRCPVKRPCVRRTPSAPATARAHGCSRSPAGFGGDK